MKKGDIILIPFPFSDLTGNKLRPAVILISGKFDVTICFITTQIKMHSRFDVEISPSKINGLKKTSLLRVDKFAPVVKDMILGKIGELEQNLMDALNKSLIAIPQLS